MSMEFWLFLKRLIDSSQIIIDRPKGSSHPRFPAVTYPVDYGYLAETTSIDGSGVDIWVGSMALGKICGVLCTVDLLKRDTELKILYDCTEEEIQCVIDFINVDKMQAIYIRHELIERTDAMTWIPESYLDLIKDETKAFACLATVMKDGTPQLTPVWFNTDGTHILINSAEGRVKDRNMRRNSSVALVILDPKDPYRYIQIRGAVTYITTEGAREHIDALSKKYRGTEKFDGGEEGEIRVIYKILPEKISD